MRLFAYIGEVFSAGAPASFSRWATAATVSTGCWALVHLVRLNHALPDPTELAALAFWMTTPYGINKIAAAVAPKTPAELIPAEIIPSQISNLEPRT
jgi:hypothetical protein